MYVIEIVVVILLVYVLPGLAVRPTLAHKPSTVLALPFVSIVVVFLLHGAMSLSDLYYPPVVQGISLILAMVALMRLYHTGQYGEGFSGWNSSTVQVLLIALALGIYFSPMLFLHGFDKDDEIYSWNLWAVQHFLAEPIDYTYTRAPYPQLFPKILSYSYMLLGGIEHQTAVKTALVVFPVTLFTLLGLAPGRLRLAHIAASLLFSVFLLRELDLKHLFDDGMPDTMMAVGVCVSVFYFLRFQGNNRCTEYLWLAVVCAVVASLTKQPALLWSMASMPLLAALLYLRQRLALTQLLIALLPLCVGLLWVFTEGQNFQENAGVTQRSFAERALTEQFVHSFKHYFLEGWQLPVLFLLGIAACLKYRQMLGPLVLFTLPSTALWLTVAAYDLRAGLPAMLTMALYLSYGGYLFASKIGEQGRGVVRPVTVFVFSLVLLVFATTDALSSLDKYREKKDPGFQPGMALRNNLVRMFAADADRVYEQVFANERAKLWTPTNYVYGLMYGYGDVSRPDQSSKSYDVHTLLGELRTTERSFASSAGDVPYGEAGAIFDRLANEQCPALFEQIAGPDNEKSVSLYRLDQALLHSDYCNPHE